MNRTLMSKTPEGDRTSTAWFSVELNVCLACRRSSVSASSLSSSIMSVVLTVMRRHSLPIKKSFVAPQLLKNRLPFFHQLIFNEFDQASFIFSDF